MTRKNNTFFYSLTKKTQRYARKARLGCRHSAILAAILVFGSRCSDQVSSEQRLVSIPEQAWMQSYQPWVHVQVHDSTLAYRIYAVIRHTQQFKYDNLLLRYGYIAPGDSARFRDVNLPLAKNNQWLGDTLGTIIETRVRLGSVPGKLPLGDNVFVMGHLMPDQPLTGILQIGIRIEAAENAISPGTGAVDLPADLRDTAAKPAKSTAPARSGS